MTRLVTLMGNPIRDLQAARAAQASYRRNASRLRAEAQWLLDHGYEGFAAMVLRKAYLVEDAAIDEARVDADDLAPVSIAPRPPCADPRCRCRLAKANDAS